MGHNFSPMLGVLVLKYQVFGCNNDDEGHPERLVDQEAALIPNLPAKVPGVDLKKHCATQTPVVEEIDEDVNFLHAVA